MRSSSYRNRTSMPDNGSAGNIPLIRFSNNFNFRENGLQIEKKIMQVFYCSQASKPLLIKDCFNRRVFTHRQDVLLQNLVTGSSVGVE